PAVERGWNAPDAAEQRLTERSGARREHLPSHLGRLQRWWLWALASQPDARIRAGQGLRDGTLVVRHPDVRHHAEVVAALRCDRGYRDGALARRPFHGALKRDASVRGRHGSAAPVRALPEAAAGARVRLFELWGTAWLYARLQPRVGGGQGGCTSRTGRRPGSGSATNSSPSSWMGAAP